jgi:hypothetical protein
VHEKGARYNLGVFNRCSYWLIARLLRRAFERNAPAAAKKATATTPAAEAGGVNATAQGAGAGRVNITADILASLGETASLGPWKITVYDVREARCIKSVSSGEEMYWNFAHYYCTLPNRKIVVVRIKTESDDAKHVSPFCGRLPCIRWYPELITDTGSKYEGNWGIPKGVVDISIPSEDIVRAAVTCRHVEFIEGTVDEGDYGYVIPESERPVALRMVYATLDRDVTVVVNLTRRAPGAAVKQSETVIVGRAGETIAVGRWRVAVLGVREALCVRIRVCEEEYCRAPRGGKLVIVTLAFENAGSEAARLTDYFGFPTLYTSEGIRVFSASPCSYGRLWLPCATEERANAIDYSPLQSFDVIRFREMGPGERAVTYVAYVVAEGDSPKRLYIVYEPMYERRAELKTIEINLD